jgi:hypothetical protein
VSVRQSPGLGPWRCGGVYWVRQCNKGVSLMWFGVKVTGVSLRFLGRAQRGPQNFRGGQGWISTLSYGTRVCLCACMRVGCLQRSLQTDWIA